MTFNKSSNSPYYSLFLSDDENSVVPSINLLDPSSGTSASTEYEAYRRTYTPMDFPFLNNESVLSPTTSYATGLRPIKKPETQDLNLSSSTIVQGNGLRYFGDQLNTFDLPSPIENLQINPLDIELANLVVSNSATAGNSGYASGSQISSENTRTFSSNVSNRFNLPNNESYKKLSYDSGVRLSSVASSSYSDYSEAQKFQYEPIAGPSTTHKSSINAKNCSSSERDQLFLKTNSIWSSTEPDVFSTAADSPFLDPDVELESDDEESLITRRNRQQDFNRSALSNHYRSAKRSQTYVSRTFNNNSNVMDPDRELSAYQFNPNATLYGPSTFQSSAAPLEYICKFCVSNKEPYDECKHLLKNDGRMIKCPVLYNFLCDICGATGDRAHTKKHCPRRAEGVNPARNNTIPTFERWHNGIVTLKEEAPY